MYRDKQLRELAVKYRETHTARETCEAFEISVSALKKWKKQLKEKGSLENKPLNRTWRKIDPEKLHRDVEEHPEDFNEERAQRFNCSAEAVRLALKKHGITKKKDRSLRQRAGGSEKGVRGGHRTDSA
jgi:transposase